jgi:histidinol-phosphate aminotransferase
MASTLDHCIQLIRPQIRKLQAYHVADASGLIKLDAMENPYSLDGDMKQKLQEALSGAELNRYPDPEAKQLKQKLQQVMQVPEHCDILLGNGSDEIIQMLATVVADENVSIMSFDPGFVMYKLIADYTGIEYIGVPLKDDFSIDMAKARYAIEQHEPAIIYIAYPNNPSANCFDDNQIEELIQLAPGFVVLDEAYHPFAQASFMNRLETYHNLLVMRTVSKLGLAGLRLGLLAGHPDIVREVNKVRLPYNINVLTQVAATVMLDNIDVLDAQAKLIREQREYVLQQMQQIEGLEVFPSQANFILFRVLSGDAGDVFDSIRAAGVLIKNMKATEGLLSNCLRVTIGTAEENQAFISALKAAIRDGA